MPVKLNNVSAIAKEPTLVVNGRVNNNSGDQNNVQQGPSNVQANATPVSERCDEHVFEITAHQTSLGVSSKDVAKVSDEKPEQVASDSDLDYVEYGIRNDYQCIQTSSNDNRCGYYALAIGIFGLDEARQAEVFNRLEIDAMVMSKIQAPYSKTFLMGVQEMIGDAIYDYALANRDDIVQSIISHSNSELSADIIASELSGNTFIQADYLVGIGRSLDLNIVLHNHNAIDGDIYIRNNNGNHYEGQLPIRMIQSLRVTEAEVDEEKFTSDVINNYWMTLTAFVNLYQNILVHRKLGKSLTVLLGPTQTGKTSLLNYLIGAEGSGCEAFTNRVGKGVQSKSSMVKKVDHGDVLLADSPGIEENRGSIVLKRLIDYQIIELLRSNPLHNLVITFKKSDFDPEQLMGNGVRDFIDFFEQHFDIRKIGDGFYERVVEGIKKEDTVTQRLMHYGEKGLSLFDSEAESFFEKTFTKFLDQLEESIQELDHIPFTTIVKNTKKNNLKLVNIYRDINEQIEELRTYIIEELQLKYKAIDDGKLEFNEDVSEKRLLNYFMVLLMIRRSILIGDIHRDSIETLTTIQNAAIPREERSFDYDSIKKTFNESSDRLQLGEFITASIERLLDNRDGVIHQITEYMKLMDRHQQEIQSIRKGKNQIRELEKCFEESKNADAMDIIIANLEQDKHTLILKKEELEKKITGLQNKLNEIDTNEIVEKKGFPKTLKAEGFWYPQAEFEHGDGDQITVSSPYKTVGTKRTIGWYGFLNWSNDYITAHNRIKKQDLHRSAISTYKVNIKEEETEIRSINEKIEKIDDDIRTLRRDFRGHIEDLKKRLQDSRVKLNKLLTTFNNGLQVNYENVSRFEADKLNILTLYHFLKDPSLQYMQSIVDENESVKRFFSECEALFCDAELDVSNTEQ